MQVEIDPQLKELLEGPFRNLECFREEQARRRAAAQEVRGEGLTHMYMYRGMCNT